MPAPLVWLEPGDPFPPVAQAWGPGDAAPGLLAAGGNLTVRTLCAAYAQGIFPWYGAGQPTLWWSPDPRMVLATDAFRVHRSLRQTLRKFRATPHCEIRVDTAFDRVIRGCAARERPGQSGTWILPEMIDAYCELHRAGFAHSVETWMNGELAGGLYSVALGRAVFGESMFSLQSDASKIALAALIAFGRAHDISLIDCQQNTAHLARLGACEMARDQFVSHVQAAIRMTPPVWRFDSVYWNLLPELRTPTGDAP